MSGDIWVFRADEVKCILDANRALVIDAVSDAYKLHARQGTSLPHSTFLRFAHLPANRIIALPAYVGGEVETAGIKWIASAPENIHKGMERASALIVLNDPETGMPWAVLEGSNISAARTAASAALAAKNLYGSSEDDCIGLVGCGRINFEVALYLRDMLPDVSCFALFDLDQDRALQLQRCIERISPSAHVSTSPNLESVLASCRLISLATTAGTPHIFDLSMCPRGTTILHVSLRDIAPEIICANDNVVDDLEHVCRAQTSIHLAQQLTGRTDFVKCSLGEVLEGRSLVRSSVESIVIFSPFGLGILDIAVGKMVCCEAMARGLGMRLKSFLPATPWSAIEEGGYSREIAAVV